jgi:stage II sporulation protein D
LKQRATIAAWTLAGLLASALAAPTAQDKVRVRLFANRQVRTCTLSSDAPLTLTDQSGVVRTVAPRGTSVTVSCQANSLSVEQGSRRFSADHLHARSHSGVIRVSDRLYRGEISLRTSNGSIVVINALPLEYYLRSVVPAEIPSWFHPEAMKAQAVLSRTIAINWTERHSREGADFCDLTHCQVYAGVVSETRASDAAVRETAGLILAFRRRRAQAFYHSTCGGHTADAKRVWPGTLWPAYLRGVPDTLQGEPACAKSSHLTWTATVSQQELDDALGLSGAAVAVIGREPCGRASEIAVRWAGGEKRLTGEQFHVLLGRKLGWARVKSAWFEIARRDGSWAFSGRGLGHGVGMCQWGANARCLAGWSFAQVLEYYFPGTRVQLASREIAFP